MCLSLLCVVAGGGDPLWHIPIHYLAVDSVITGLLMEIIARVLKHDVRTVMRAGSKDGPDGIKLALGAWINVYRGDGTLGRGT